MGRTVARRASAGGSAIEASPAAAITKLHESPDLLTTMSAAARAKSAELTWDRSIDTLEQILVEAIAAGRRS